MLFSSLSVPEYEVVRIHSVRHVRRNSDNVNADAGGGAVHRVRLDTHGKRVDLALSQNRHLLRQDRPLEVWYAEGGKEPTAPNVTYVPGPEVKIQRSLSSL